MLSGPWSYFTSPDCINFTADKPIKLYGVQYFGSEGGGYTVSTEVKDTTNGSSLVKQSGVYTSVKDETDTYYGFDVQFDRPVCLEENKEYRLESFIEGPRSWYGEVGQTSMEYQGIRVAFRTSSGLHNSTSDLRGQFPALWIGWSFPLQGDSC